MRKKNSWLFIVHSPFQKEPAVPYCYSLNSVLLLPIFLLYSSLYLLLYYLILYLCIRLLLYLSFYSDSRNV